MPLPARVLFLAALILLSAPATAQQSKQDRDWIAHCASQISGTNKSRAQTYCRCMAQTVDTSEKIRQTELERSFPPVHKDCFKKAGFKIPN
jgi:hypothetical protein